MRFDVWFPIFTLILGQGLVVAAKWLEIFWTRRQATKAQERTLLYDMQEAVDAFMRAWSRLQSERMGELIPPEPTVELVFGGKVGVDTRDN
jgi:hypothetical protein